MSARLSVHRRTRYKMEIQESCNHWSSPVMPHCPASQLLYSSYVSRSTWGLTVITVNLASCACRISLSSLKEICMYLFIPIKYIVWLSYVCIMRNCCDGETKSISTSVGFTLSLSKFKLLSSVIYGWNFTLLRSDECWDDTRLICSRHLASAALYCPRSIKDEQADANSCFAGI